MEIAGLRYVTLDSNQSTDNWTVDLLGLKLLFKKKQPDLFTEVSLNNSLKTLIYTAPKLNYMTFFDSLSVTIGSNISKNFSSEVVIFGDFNFRQENNWVQLFVIFLATSFSFIQPQWELKYLWYFFTIFPELY